MTTMQIDRAVVEQALEALEYAQQDRECPSTTRQAIAALRAVLAQQAEPVAWRCACGANLYLDEYGHPASRAAPRYGKPQQAEPVGTRALIEECLAAFAEELAAWDIDPPLHHLKQAHDKCEAWLAALAQQAEPGAPVPAAVVATQSDVWRGYNGQWAPPGEPIKMVQMLRDLPTGTLLYAAPPRRTMVPLTEEEIKTAFHAARNAKLGASQDNSRHRLSVIEIARAVEKASWEKNHGQA